MWINVWSDWKTRKITSLTGRKKQHIQLKSNHSWKFTEKLGGEKNDNLEIFLDYSQLSRKHRLFLKRASCTVLLIENKSIATNYWEQHAYLKIKGVVEIKEWVLPST